MGRRAGDPIDRRRRRRHAGRPRTARRGAGDARRPAPRLRSGARRPGLIRLPSGRRRATAAGARSPRWPRSGRRPSPVELPAGAPPARDQDRRRHPPRSRSRPRTRDRSLPTGTGSSATVVSRTATAGCTGSPAAAGCSSAPASAWSIPLTPADRGTDRSPSPARPGSRASSLRSRAPAEVVGDRDDRHPGGRGEPDRRRRRRLGRRELAAERPGWRWSSVRVGDERSSRPRPASPNRIEFGFAARPDGAALRGVDGDARARRPCPSQPELIPAVVSDRFLELSGAAVGDEVAASVAGQRLTLRIVGSTAAVPVARSRQGIRDRRRDDPRAGAAWRRPASSSRRRSGGSSVDDGQRRGRRGGAPQATRLRRRRDRPGRSDPGPRRRPDLARDHRRARARRAGRARVCRDRLRRLGDGHDERADHGVRDPPGPRPVRPRAGRVGLARERVPARLRARRGLGAWPRPRLARPAVRHADRRPARPPSRRPRSSFRGRRSCRSTAPRSSCSS